VDIRVIKIKKMHGLKIFICAAVLAAAFTLGYNAKGSYEIPEQQAQNTSFKTVFSPIRSTNSDWVYIGTPKAIEARYGLKTGQKQGVENTVQIAEKVEKIPKIAEKTRKRALSKTNSTNNLDDFTEPEFNGKPPTNLAIHYGLNTENTLNEPDITILLEGVTITAKSSISKIQLAQAKVDVPTKTVMLV
jgi:hypothetical protein